MYDLQIAVAEQSKLKQVIAAKSSDNSRAIKQIDRIEKEKNTLKLEVQNATVALQHARSEVNEKEHECRNLYRALADEEKKCAQMTQKVDAVQNEKDHLNAELVKKKEELESMEEKHELVILELDRGKSHTLACPKCTIQFSIISLTFSAEKLYMERIEDIRILQIEVKNLRHRNWILTRGIAETIDTRHEVLQLHRDLTQERVKSKAFEEMLATPLNIHRWRKLTGKDPEKMDLIVKIQTLQK